MFINQLRMKIGVMFGSPETTTGGHALKYYASVRLDIRRIGQVKSGEEVVGNRTKIKVVKNKLAPPFSQAELDIRYGSGIDAVGDLLDSAVERGIIEKRGAFYNVGEQSLGQGRERARESLLADAALRVRLAEQVLASRPTRSRAAQADDASDGAAPTDGFEAVAAN
jgi:recombination protein RecA